MIEHIERLLKSRIGLDAESVGRSVIERAVRQRMQAQHKSTLEDYWITLNGSPKEQQALVEAVVVPETWFFRYPESFKALATLALERCTQLNTTRPLRIISLPCSSGEEPYSIAMALLDAGFAAEQFQIEALDVSDKVLEQARKGLYGRNSFREPAYHRADISLTWKRPTRWGDGAWQFGVYNAYNRINIFYMDFGYDDRDNRVLKGYGLFPLIPSISYSFEF